MLLKKITDGKTVDISVMNKKELNFLSYELELGYARLIKNSQPFSQERLSISKEGYAVIQQITKRICELEGIRIENKAFGLNKYDISLAKTIVKKVLNIKKRCVFFEAGVGSGKLIESLYDYFGANMEFAKIDGKPIAGCDFVVDKNFIKGNLSGLVYEGSIYDCMSKIEDGAIDVFYWNDVFEHIPEDEIDKHIELIKKKLAQDAFLITITPNKLKGPSDVTMLFEPKGSIAKGFHFREYTFTEVIGVYKKHGFKEALGVWVGFYGFIRKRFQVSGHPKIISALKKFVEKICPIFPWIIRKLLLAFFACHVSVVTKTK